MLAWTIYLSFAGALLEAILPKGRAGLARAVALIVALAGLVIAAAGFMLALVLREAFPERRPRC